MKNIRTHVLAALAAATLLAHASPGNSVRYSVDADMTATGVDLDATGRVQAYLKQQGKADQRRIRVRVTNLDSNSTFTLQAIAGDDDAPINVGSFTTDNSGKATITYVEHSAGKAKATRKNKHVLPEIISEVTTVRTLLVVNGHNEVLLSTDLHSADTLDYQVATALTNTGNDPDAIGVLAAAIQHGTVQFRLFAMGQSSAYTLAINDEDVANYAADFAGGIAVGTYPSKAPEPMKFRDVTLKNANNVVILESHVH